MAGKPAPTNTAPGMIYMLCGATQHSNTDPFDHTSPAIPIGPHWMIIWMLWVAYPIVTLFRRERLELWESLLYLYVAGYIAGVLFIGKDITSYGGWRAYRAASLSEGP